MFAALGLLGLPLVFALPRWSGRKRMGLMILGALALRVALFPAPASDDVNRYLWEGRLVLMGENPYAVKADDPSRAAFRDQVWEGMNHKNITSVYPPGNQWLSAAAVWVAYEPWPFKLLVCLGDLAVLMLVITLLRRTGSPLEWAGFYAFNPVPLIAFAAEGHPDSLMMAAVCWMVLAAESGKWRLAWLLLAVAVQIKLVPVLLAPLLFRRDQVRHLWIPALVLLVPGLPFVGAASAWIEGLQKFAGWVSFNSPVRGILSWAGVPRDWAKWIASILLGTAAVSAFLAHRRGLPLRHACLTVMGALVICAPFTHFWYLSWVMPLVALRPSLGWVVASIMQSGYFIAWWGQEFGEGWGFSPVYPLIVWLPALLAFAMQQRGLPEPLQRVFGHRRLFEFSGTDGSEQRPCLADPRQDSET